MENSPRSNPLSIHDVIMLEDEYRVNQMIENGADIDCYDVFHWTPLHLAIRLGNIDIIKLLLKRKANIEARNEKEQTPLDLLLDEWKIKSEDIKMKISNIVQLLIENNADYKHTMYLAIIQGYEDFLQLLLANGANPNVHLPKQAQGCTPLLLAIYVKCEDMVKCLLSYGANVDLENESDPDIIPINLAIQNGSLQIARYLLQNKAIINTKKCIAPIMFAIQTGSREALELLIKFGADTNISKDNGTLTPLLNALYSKAWDIAKSLIKHGAQTKPNFVFSAVNHKCDDVELLEMLIGNGGDVNFKLKLKLLTPLHLACKYGLSNAAKILLKYGANGNNKDLENMTPLEYASCNNQIKVYKVIIAFLKQSSKTRVEGINK